MQFETFYFLLFNLYEKISHAQKTQKEQKAQKGKIEQKKQKHK